MNTLTNLFMQPANTNEVLFWSSVLGMGLSVSNRLTDSIVGFNVPLDAGHFGDDFTAYMTQPTVS